MTGSRTAILLFAAGASLAAAQDPAPGWMGYATAKGPDGAILTSIEATWVVPKDPERGGSFFSPWFGIESHDNLDLIQPVNPWTGSGWEIYNEVFEWSPEHNFNSEAHGVRAGDTVYGKITYCPNNHTYTIYHSSLADGWSVTNSIPIQQTNDGSYKKFTMAYFVMEKSQWECDQYPANGEVVFKNITIAFDNKVVSPTWTTSYVDDNCDCRAHIVDPNTVSITWDTSSTAKTEVAAPGSLHTLRGSVPAQVEQPQQAAAAPAVATA